MKANNEAEFSNKDSEIILYIAEKLEEDPNYGATLLNKVLYLLIISIISRMEKLYQILNMWNKIMVQHQNQKNS